MRWGSAGSAALAAVLIAGRDAHAQTEWWSAADIGVATTFSGGKLPAVGLGLNLGANIVDWSRAELRANLTWTSPVAYAGDKVCLAAPPNACHENRGASQVGTLSGELGLRPLGRESRFILIATVGAYRANAAEDQSSAVGPTDPTTDLVVSGGFEWRFGSASNGFPIAFRYLKFRDLFRRNADAFGISFSRTFRL